MGGHLSQVLSIALIGCRPVKAANEGKPKRRPGGGRLPSVLDTRSGLKHGTGEGVNPPSRNPCSPERS